MANTALNRTVVSLLTNKSGGALNYGDVVILDNTNDDGFTTTTTAGLSTRQVGVIVEPNGIANNATGLVATCGWVPKVNLNTAATRGQFLKTHTVAGQATPHNSPQGEGDFGVALRASATPSAILFGSPNEATSGAPGGSSGDFQYNNAGSFAGVSLPNLYINLQDQKAQNTSGGTFTSGAWQTRVLNTEVSDAGGLCALASNQFTLSAGTYLIRATAPAWKVDRHQTRLQNITDGSTVLIGSSQVTSAADFTDSISSVRGVFTIAAAKALEIQHQCQTTEATNGFGLASNFTTEVYTIVELWKIA